MTGAVVGAVLVAYNAATNLLPYPRSLYLPSNALATAFLVFLGIRWDLDLGLSASGWQVGVAIVAVVWLGAVVVLAAARRRPQLQRRLRDGRTAGASGREVAFHGLLRIPFGTALFEEVAFRGLLLALVGVWWQALAFGLWHIGPTVAALRANDRPARLLPVLVAVVVTAVGGVAFAWLRLATGGLVAPVLAHWSLNTSGIVLTVTVDRWLSSRELPVTP